MFGRIARSRATVGVVCTALGAAVVGGFAWAAVPSTNNGQISACYPTSGVAKGQLRVIDYQAGERCRAGEAPVSWQQRGLRFRGAWSAATGYTRDDVVTRSGAAYVATTSNTNRQPPNATYWAAMSETPGAAALHRLSPPGNIRGREPHRREPRASRHDEQLLQEPPRR
jgi:hypothetical protein